MSQTTCGWAIASFIVLATWIGRSKVAHPFEYTITSSKGTSKPRFLADNVEHTKSSTHTSVHIPTTKISTNKKSYKISLIVALLIAVLQLIYTPQIPLNNHSNYSIQADDLFVGTGKAYLFYLVISHPIYKQIGAIFFNWTKKPINAIFASKCCIWFIL